MKKLIILIVLIPLFSFGHDTTKQKQPRLYGTATAIFSNAAYGGGATVGANLNKIFAIGVGFDILSFNDLPKNIAVPLFLEARIMLPQKSRIVPIASINYGSFTFDHQSEKTYSTKYDWSSVSTKGKSMFGGTFGILIKNRKKPYKGVFVGGKIMRYTLQIESTLNMAQYDNNGKYAGYNQKNYTSLFQDNFGAFIIGLKI